MKYTFLVLLFLYSIARADDIFVLPVLQKCEPCQTCGDCPVCETCEVCPKPPPAPPPVPVGCVRKNVVQAWWAVSYIQDLQFQVEWPNGDVTHIETFDQSKCTRTYDGKWRCGVAWPVPKGAWYWVWTVRRVKQFQPVCAFGG